MNKNTSQKYIEIINNLSYDAFEIIATSLWPYEIKEMLLHAPLCLLDVVIDGALSDLEVINTLSEDALERIGGLILADEMKVMLIGVPHDLRKKIIDEYLDEQKRIYNLN